MLQHLPLTDESYQTARELLTKRYQNVRRLADLHVEQILALPSVGASSELRSGLLNPLLVALNALRRLEIRVDEWSFILLHVVLSKLPSDVRVRFEREHGGEDSSHLPLFSDLQQFLEDECRRSDNSAPSAPRPPKLTAKPAGAGPRRVGAVAQGRTCALCRDETHSLPSCPQFKQRPAHARRGLAQQRGWCFMCLGPHFMRECPAGPRRCADCSGTHHPLLCTRGGHTTVSGGSSRGGGSGRGSRVPSLQGEGSGTRSPPRREDRKEFPSERAGGRSPQPRGGGPRTQGESQDVRGSYMATRRELVRAAPIASPHREFSPPTLEWPRVGQRASRHSRDGPAPSTQLAGCIRARQPRWTDERFDAIGGAMARPYPQ